MDALWRTGNSFLDALPEETRSHMRPLLRRSAMNRGTIVAEPGSVVSEVVFPVSCAISMLTQMSSGACIEVGIAGHEGLAGIAILFGNRENAQRLIVQAAGDAYCIGADSFLAHVVADERLRLRLRNYIGYVLTAATQFAACNRLHPLAERFARWLLMMSDRIASNTVPLTHDVLSEMLGVRRAGVTVVVGALSKAGIIHSIRGAITIVNRSELEDVACECYGTVNAALQRMTGYGARQIVMPKS